MANYHTDNNSPRLITEPNIHNSPQPAPREQTMFIEEQSRCENPEETNQHPIYDQAMQE